MRFSLLLSVPAFGEPRIRLHKNIDRVKNIERGSRFQIWGLIVTLPVFKRAIISYPFLPFCNGRCWHQKIAPWPKSEKARQRCPLPSQWMLHMNSKANMEVQVSRTCTGEREGASFKSFNNLPAHFQSKESSAQGTNPILPWIAMEWPCTENYTDHLQERGHSNANEWHEGWADHSWTNSLLPAVNWG